MDKKVFYSKVSETREWIFLKKYIIINILLKSRRMFVTI